MVVVVVLLRGCWCYRFVLKRGHVLLRGSGTICASRREVNGIVWLDEKFPLLFYFIQCLVPRTGRAVREEVCAVTPHSH